LWSSLADEALPRLRNVLVALVPGTITTLDAATMDAVCRAPARAAGW
jgi:hypothetical protein